MSEQKQPRKKTLKSRLTNMIVWFCMIQFLLVAGGYSLTVGSLTVRANQHVEEVKNNVYGYTQEIVDYAQNIATFAAGYIDYSLMNVDDKVNTELSEMLTLLQLCLVDPKMSDACVLLPEEKLLIDARQGIIYSPILVERNDSYRIYMDNGAENISEGFYYFSRSDKSQQFVYLKCLHATSRKPGNVYLLLQLNQEKFMNLAHSRDSVDGETVVLMREGVLHSTRPIDEATTAAINQWFEKDSRPKTVRVDGVTYLADAGEYSVMGITPVHLVPRSKHYAELYRFLGVMGVSLVVNLFIWIYFARSLVFKTVYGPVMDLVSSLERVKNNDYDIIQKEFHEREWDEVTGVFNMMVQRIEANTKETYQKDLLMKNMELKFLQNQINPHFLYNTLDSIAYKANDGEIEDVNKIISCLSKMYRLVFNKGKDLLDIENVLLCCKMFFEICRYKYSNFDFRIRCEEGLGDIEIVNLIIQTLCENAVVHGYDASRKKFIIVVRARRVGDTLYFDVIDNGRGINADRLEVFNKLLQNKNAKSESGLANASRRVRLYYGDEYGITLSSKQGHFTKVTVTMPAVNEQETFNPLDAYRDDEDYDEEEYE